MSSLWFIEQNTPRGWVTLTDQHYASLKAAFSELHRRGALASRNFYRVAEYTRVSFHELV